MFRGRGSVSSMVELKVEDVKPNLFQNFLEVLPTILKCLHDSKRFSFIWKFIYTDQLDATPLEALHLQELGQKYKVQPLIQKCEPLLGGRITLENAVEMYETAEKYGFVYAKMKAEDLIVRLGSLYTT